jgi:hypothetical protein
MTVGLFDQLEPIEVQKHHGQNPAVTVGARNGLRQADIEQRAVGQASLLVMHAKLAHCPLSVA